jgi:hypothetical protein
MVDEFVNMVWLSSGEITSDNLTRVRPPVRRSCLSINKRTCREYLEPLNHGGCLSCLVHYIISNKLTIIPKKKTLGRKSDFMAAYRWVHLHLHGDTAEKCTITYKEFGSMSLWLTFG